MNTEWFLSICIVLGFNLIALSIFLAFMRVYIGPELADRVLGLDMMTVSIVSFCGLYAVSSEDPVFLDIAMVMALIGFLATVALARYADRKKFAEKQLGDY